MPHRDVYAESQGLAEHLAEQGHEDAARRIEDAIRGGSTSSEILFDLRSELNKLLDDGRVLDTQLYARTLELRSPIDGG